ncbi:MAG: radical SAM family heme chaperone HemW [Nitrospira sp.]|nr:radical SAM family heme chaperone HemW [Nitrospira sp.]MBX7041055.1 radical SAM family heme chaperone HemW [Nitrospira sp.]MCW5793640.1 radical SAM family heme chaperone HemW [Nitrospira sp.]HMU30160.1 radical SAM family heme chaperone HemW [Nitrospira sp.]HMV57414.1 radical SAM family heme chaperone HemW [Nitrospira sp.]
MSQATAQGLYIHIPFCHQRCHFCAFYLEIHQARAAEEFVSALLTEVRVYGESGVLRQDPLDSIYFGGGTPTTLSSQQLATLLATSAQVFGLAPDAEVTIEAHPGSVSRDSLAHLREAGCTRLSFGAESMDQTELDRVGRPGSPSTTLHVMAMAREAGFTNINLDLMYGLPGQTLESWATSLRQTIELAPEHLSCYALTIEEGTHLKSSIQRGLLPAPDEELQNRMEDLAEEILGRAGYDRYEISNYCRPGCASRHNRLHWTGGHYLGVGPSAQSYIGGRRFGNVSDLTAYKAALRNGRLPVSESDQLTQAGESCERLIFGLRLVDGISLTQTGALSFPELSREVDKLLADELLERKGDLVRLTTRGRRYADTVAVSLLTSLDE